jgi:signal transduction histidine kinase
LSAPRRATRLTLLLAGIIVVAGGAVTMLVQRRATAGAVPAAFGQVDWMIASALLLAAAALVAAGGAAWFARPGGSLAIVAIWAAAAWLAPELTASQTVPREVRSLARVLAPMVTPLLVHTAILAPSAQRRRSVATPLLAAGYAIAVIVALGHAFTWDPYRVLTCPPPCAPGDNLLLVRADIGLSERFLVGWAVLTLAAGAALVLSESAGLIRGRGRRGTERAIRASAAAMGLAMVWWAWGRLGGDDSPRVDLSQVPALTAMSLAVIAIGITTTVGLSVELRRLRVVRHLTDSVGTDDAPWTLARVLAATLDDRTVRVAYPLESGEVVDVAGQPITLSIGSSRRRFASIERLGRTVAVVEHADTVDAGPFAREIGTAARLAVENERLVATVRARLRQLQESRARIVSTGDAARRRIERDLHDGAQQRLLAVSYELRIARASVTDPGSTSAVELDGAIERLDRALNELRELAHGIHPAVLSEAGLDAAIRSLAETSPLPIELDVDLRARCAPATESAVYAAVAEAVQRATADGARRLDVALRNERDTLRVELAYDTPAGAEGWERVEDRVGAAGGQATLAAGAGGLRLRLEMPCA